MTRRTLITIGLGCLVASAIANWFLGIHSGATSKWLYLVGILAWGLLMFPFFTIPLLAFGTVFTVSGIRKTDTKDAIIGFLVLSATWIGLGVFFAVADLSVN